MRITIEKRHCVLFFLSLYVVNKTQALRSDPNPNRIVSQHERTQSSPCLHLQQSLRLIPVLGLQLSLRSLLTPFPLSVSPSQLASPFSALLGNPFPPPLFRNRFSVSVNLTFQSVYFTFVGEFTLPVVVWSVLQLRLPESLPKISLGDFLQFVLIFICTLLFIFFCFLVIFLDRELRLLFFDWSLECWDVLLVDVKTKGWWIICCKARNCFVVVLILMLSASYFSFYAYE